MARTRAVTSNAVWRFLYLLPVLLVLVGTATIGVRAVARQQAEGEAYERAMIALEDGDLLEAEREFAAAGNYKDAPQQSQAVRERIAPYASQYNDGVLALRRGDFDAAIASFTPVARDLPDYEQTLDLLEQALQGRLTTLLSEADAALAQSRWSDAEILLATIASEYPENLDARNRLLSFQREHAAYIFSLEGALHSGHPGEDQTTLITDEVAVSWPVWSPDRTRIAFITPGDQRNGYVRSIYVINADGTELRKVAENPARWRAPLWSPDGTKIAYEIDGPNDGDPTGDVTIKIVDVDTEAVTDLIGNQLPQASSPAWSPTGDRIAFVVRVPERSDQSSPPIDPGIGLDHSAVYVKNLSTGEITLAAGGQIPNPWRITWSPVSEEILVFSRPDGTSFRRGGLYHLDLSSDSYEAIDLMSIDISMPTWSPNGRYFVYVVRSNEIRVVGGDEVMKSVLTDLILTGGITWSPSADRFIALGNPTAGGSAMVDVQDTGITVEKLRLNYDADGGDAGPPNWSPSHPMFPAGFDPLSAPAFDPQG